MCGNCYVSCFLTEKDLLKKGALKWLNLRNILFSMDHCDYMALAYREMMDYSVLTVTDWPLLLYLVLVCCPSGSSGSLL